ncbi:MAG: gamma carbonic anhydrase family protein [Chloroflexi bacterium]|nr:gamma carbonic anhydrase family protein [Chloroflexota bacterium]
MIKHLGDKAPKIAASAFISETAYIVGDVEIGENSGVWPGAVLRADFGSIKIGNNSHVEDNAVVHSGEPMIIEDNVLIGHGAVIHCRRIGKNSLIGNNATVLDGAEIGEFCMVAAGSVVTAGMKVPDESLVVGVPAKVRSKITAAQRSYLHQGAVEYGRLARQYREQGGL